MGLFGAIKNTFGQAVILDSSEKDKLIIKPSLKKDALKLNTEILVDEGFDMVVCHIDSVCDCLSSGRYKFNDVDLPKLHKFAKAKKTKKGYVTPKTVPADLYYINKSQIERIPIIMARRFKALHGDKKVKVKLLGSFDVKVCDSKKFVTLMLMDYAVLKDEKIRAELGAYCGYELLKVLEKNLYSIGELSSNDEALIKTLNEEVGEGLRSLGIEVNNIKINRVLVPKSVEASENPVNHVDTRIDDIFNEAYGNPTTKEEKNIDSEASKIRQEILANNIKADKEKEAKIVKANSVINLGFGGFAPSQSETKTDDVIINSTVDEYEKASKAFTNNAYKKQNDLVFFGNTESKLPEPELVQTMSPPTPVEQKQENDIMLGRNTISSINNDNKVEIEDIDVQKDRKRELEKLKESLTEDEPIKRPKVLKASQNACKYCGNVLSAKADFCPRCGKSTLGIRYCKACGEANNENDLICKICGSRL